MDAKHERKFKRVKEMLDDGTTYAKWLSELANSPDFSGRVARRLGLGWQETEHAVQKGHFLYFWSSEAHDAYLVHVQPIVKATVKHIEKARTFIVKRDPNSKPWFAGW